MRGLYLAVTKKWQKITLGDSVVILVTHDCCTFWEFSCAHGSAVSPLTYLFYQQFTQFCAYPISSVQTSRTSHSVPGQSQGAVLRHMFLTFLSGIFTSREQVCNWGFREVRSYLPATSRCMIRTDMGDCTTTTISRAMAKTKVTSKRTKCAQGALLKSPPCMPFSSSVLSWPA